MTKPKSFYGWTLLVVLWLILFINFSFPVVGPSVINTFMAADLHLNRSTLGLSFAVFQWMAGLPAPLVAMSVNRKGSRFTLALGGLLLVLGSLVMALFVRSGTQAVLTFGVIIGLGVICGGPLAGQAAVSRWFVNKRALAISLLLSASSVGGFIAPTLLNRVIEAFHGNWRAGWWLVSGLCAVSALLAIFFVKENPADIGQFPDGDPTTDFVDASIEGGSKGAQRVFKTQQEWTYGQVLRTPVWWALLIAPIGFSIGWFFFLAHGVIHLRDLGYSPAQAAHSMSVLLFLGLAGTLLVAFLGDRIEPRLILAGAVLSFGVGMMLVLNAKGTAGLYTYALFLGLGFGSAVPSTMTIISNYFGTKPYASLVGLSMAFGTTLGAFASWGGGFVFDHFGSYSSAFYSISISCLIGFLILLFLKPPVRKAPQIS